MTEAERCMIEEAHLITGLPPRTLQSLSARGEIWGAAKLGRRWTYDRMRLRAWVRANEAANENLTASTNAVEFITRVSPFGGKNFDNPLKQAIERKQVRVDDVDWVPAGQREQGSSVGSQVSYDATHAGYGTADRLDDDSDSIPF